ncbi:hypothetical protein NFD59_12625 (plasmid) [Staphylococcus epidermidis]|nr:hypothetical protein NFD59_12625 [Staphylococcus epidermidis]
MRKYFATDAYETEDKVDNILEHKLGVYESEIEKIIDYIIKILNLRT